MWNWDRVKDSIRSLRGRLGFEDVDELHFLGFRLSLSNGEVFDEILNRKLEFKERLPLYFILHNYSLTSNDIGLSGKLITFMDLSKIIGPCPTLGREVLKNFESTFGYNLSLLFSAARFFKHEVLDLGDASIKIYSLPRVPIVLIVWGGDEEVSPSSNVMFDETIINYLPTVEIITRLTSITIRRLIDASRISR
ncbi:MAG: DUF3786 domain-containing protein [Candidatus Methanomethylicia archaeon]